MKQEKSFEKVKLINLKNPPSLIRAISIELIKDHLGMGRNVIRFVPPKTSLDGRIPCFHSIEIVRQWEVRIPVVLKTIRVKTDAIAII